MRLRCVGVLLAIIACVLHGNEGANSSCSAVTEWTCHHDKSCLPISKRYNGVNDCVDNSDEVSFTCLKNTSFHCSSGTCIPLTYRLDGDRDCGDGIDEGKIVGTFCNSSWYGPCSQFIPNSYCQENTTSCQCLLGYLVTDLLDACEKRILKDPCSISDDCSYAVANSFCDDGNCTCLSGHYPEGNGTNCTQRVLGDPCSINADCVDVIANSECFGQGSNDTYCKCSPGWLPNEGTVDECRRRVLHVDSCVTNVECSSGVPHSICQAGTCVCDVGSIMDSTNTSCSIRKIYESCLSSAECSGVAHSKCNAGSVCVCLAGYFVNTARDTCTKIKVGDPCAETKDCTGSMANSYCSGGTCACAIGYLPSADNSTCRPRRIGIDTCTSDEDCSSVRYSNCTDGTCNCYHGYRVPTGSDSVCEKVVLGSSTCTVHSECSAYVTYSRCENGLCACVPDYVADSDVCRTRKLGDPCASLADCEKVVVNSMCYSGTCLCLSGWIKETSTTCRQRVLGADPCITDTDCTAGVPNSLCHSNKTCICGPGHEATPDNYNCLSFGQSTEECADFVKCKPWAIALIIVFILLPPIITGVVMLTYKNIQDRKSRLLRDKRNQYGRNSDPMIDLGMAAIPTITTFTAPRDTALHSLPEIGADWSLDNDDTSGLVIREKSFFRDMTPITSNNSGFHEKVMSKVDVL